MTRLAIHGKVSRQGKAGQQFWSNPAAIRSATNPHSHSALTGMGGFWTLSTRKSCRPEVGKWLTPTYNSGALDINPTNFELVVVHASLPSEGRSSSQIPP